ncbi:helix-turn-helix transcriptional regulator [Pseudomonas sp. PB101]|jgi:LuxR family quorum-sensing transcriptional regulator LasR|uniref:helix-turn-helix transcriptional regulator n=1 Tax=Pseudomonas sp. PB101 TaxID=2495428 RepID=UPI001366247E|nr:LuxR family transcriptional regulator [Pseudomonas sp. PB101]MVW86159.1 LuxR family transcriptional regulator [Pseudomonas sp. PB101]
MISLDELLTMSDLSRKSDWFEALKSNTTALGCDGVLFAFKPNSSTDNNQAIILSDYPAAWRKKYDTEHYARIDPVVAHCLTSTVPIVWFDNIYTSVQQLNFREEAKNHGLMQGVSLPVHGAGGQVGMLSARLEAVPERQLKYHLARTLPSLTLIRDYALDTLLKLIGKEEADEPVALTNRELEVLKWSAFGKTTWEIARILSCSEANINYHFSKVRAKFNVGSRRMAIVKALQTGVLEF